MGQSWPLDMYSPQRIAEIKGNPATKLVFSCEPITNRLKAEMIAEKEQSIKLVEEAVDLWRSLEGSIPTTMYDEVFHLLRGNIDDAILWRMAFDMYMDMKLGKLTEDRIDAALEECKARGLRGTVLDDPLNPAPQQSDICHAPSSFKLFAEQLRKEVRAPYLDQYEETYQPADPELRYDVVSNEE